MISIEEYIAKPLSERQAHLKLNESCIERGGSETTISIMMRGVLSYVFNTTIPSGQHIHACHACNNWKCSNINHVYWGTVKENRADAAANGKHTKTGWQRTVEKYGLVEARRLCNGWRNRIA